MKKYICPYCFREHLFSEIEFRCVNINPDDCPEEKDEPPASGDEPPEDGPPTPPAGTRRAVGGYAPRR